MILFTSNHYFRFFFLDEAEDMSSPPASSTSRTLRNSLPRISDFCFLPQVRVAIHAARSSVKSSFLLLRHKPDESSMTTHLTAPIAAVVLRRGCVRSCLRESDSMLYGALASSAVPPLRLRRMALRSRCVCLFERSISRRRWFYLEEKTCMFSFDRLLALKRYRPLAFRSTF